MSAKREIQSIPLYFDPKRIAAGLYQVSEQAMQTKSMELRTYWYTGPDQLDIFLWEDLGGNLIKQQITYCGQVVEWNIVDGIKTGVVIEEESFEPGIKASELINYDTIMISSSLQQAIQLVEFIEILSEKRKNEILNNLNGNSTIDSMSHEEFWQKFGNKDIAYSKSKTWMGFKIVWYYFKKIFGFK